MQLPSTCLLAHNVLFFFRLQKELLMHINTYTLGIRISTGYSGTYDLHKYSHSFLAAVMKELAHGTTQSLHLWSFIRQETSWTNYIFAVPRKVLVFRVWLRNVAVVQLLSRLLVCIHAKIILISMGDTLGFIVTWTLLFILDKAVVNHQPSVLSWKSIYTIYIYIYIYIYTYIHYLTRFGLIQAYADYDDMLRLTEDMVAKICNDVCGNDLTANYVRFVHAHQNLSEACQQK